MNDIPLVAADFSPATAWLPVACATGAIAFTSGFPERNTVWLALDGSGRVEPPKDRFPIDYRPGNVPRIDPIAPHWRLEMEASPMALVLVSRGKRLVVQLPHVLATDVLAIDRGFRPDVSFAREIDTLAIRGKHSTWWMPVAPLIALEGASSARWSIRKVLPSSNRAARDEGEVVISAYGRTNIRVGSRALMLGKTPLIKGERVTLVDLLADTNGILRYREIVRADGERIPIERAPDDVEIVATIVQSRASNERAEVPIPVAMQRVIEAMQREGLLAALTPAVYAQIAKPKDSWAPDPSGLSPFEMLYRYYRGGRGRAAKDKFIAHDAQFRDETDDVVAELAAPVGGDPLFVQVRAEIDSLRVRGRGGEKVIDLDEGFDGVVDAFNEELRARKDPRRFVALESGDPRRCFLLLEREVADRLRGAGVPLERVRWG
jgi:hypothetical protein